MNAQANNHDEQFQASQPENHVTMAQKMSISSILTDEGRDGGDDFYAGFKRRIDQLNGESGQGERDKIVNFLGHELCLLSERAPLEGERMMASVKSLTSEKVAAEIMEEMQNPFKRKRDEEESRRVKLKLESPKPKLQNTATAAPPRDRLKEARAVEKQYDNIYLSIWKDLSRKDGPKGFRVMQQSQQSKLVNLRKTALLAARESKRWQVKTNKTHKDVQTKARRSMREMLNFWKRNEREERDLRKKAEREAFDKTRKEEEEREARRQARKLNFLITQTELYSHFVGGKMNDLDTDLSAAELEQAKENAQSAVLQTQQRTKQFEKQNEGEMNFQNPTSLGEINIDQPNLMACTLKEYQLKGLNWLANLYDQGINGILADEMGLGKTVQSISVLAYLAESLNIWGPFLVVTPASTLHNWQQEISKFVPQFKVLPYWGNAKDRKVLRKFWDRKNIVYDRDSPFHVLVTSYQLIVADAQYFQRIKWQYMILDEAQAIKSSASSRWKSLLGLQCRNRLLLTGTPIQNSMQELWALLHFIMPSLFDSHDEFSEWFSKDIESHAQSNTQLNEQQLNRLHMILKPFMLRRIKKNVQSELGDKVEIDVFCSLTSRQKKLYQMVKSQISMLDILQESESDSLTNLVMQFRKVCNHPDLFERADTQSAFCMCSFAETGSFLREQDMQVEYSSRNLISFKVPRLVFEMENNLIQPFIYHPSNVAKSDAFSWHRMAGVSPADVYRAFSVSLIRKAIRSKYAPPAKGEIILPSNHFGDDLKELHSVQYNAYQNMYMNSSEQCYYAKASAPPVEAECHSQRFQIALQNSLFDQEITSALAPLSLNTQYELLKNSVPPSLWPPAEMDPPRAKRSLSTIRLPSMKRFIIESCKLAKLTELLADLKKNGHKVLIYFQMTKMMDLMEEFLTFKQYKYIRLDGSSKLNDRRDLVHDWQTRPDLFVFLLSTRAGGLGINLTAADTVIFYDSDWNPTIDSQAMDRAHRLGQTRQVTVYRLLVKGTIEERMRDRAKQKEHVQQVVMEGKAVEKETAASKRKDMAMLLMDDESL